MQRRWNKLGNEKMFLYKPIHAVYIDDRHGHLLRYILLVDPLSNCTNHLITFRTRFQLDLILFTFLLSDFCHGILIFTCSGFYKGNSGVDCHSYTMNGLYSMYTEIYFSVNCRSSTKMTLRQTPMFKRGMDSFIYNPNIFSSLGSKIVS